MMNEDFRNNSIDPELQVRLLNLVMGEASDFERDQLQAMMEQRPELAAYHQHLQHLHGLLQEVGSGEFPLESDFASKSDLESDSGADTDADSAADSESMPWRMSAERREKLLAVLQGDSTGAIIPEIDNAAPSTKSSTAKAEITQQEPSDGSSSVQRKITWWRRSPRRLAELAAVSACLLLGLFLILPSMQAARDAAAAVGLSRKFSVKQYGLATDEGGEKAYTIVVPQARSSGEPATYFFKDDVEFKSGTVESLAARVAQAGTKDVTVLPAKPTQQLDALRASTSGELFGNDFLHDLYGANETHGSSEQQINQNALLGDGEIRGRSSSVDDFERKPTRGIASQPSPQLGGSDETEAVKERFRSEPKAGFSTHSWDVTKSPAEKKSAQTDSQIASLVETYNDFMDKGEYNQAEVVAKQVQELSPAPEMGSLLARNQKREGEFGLTEIDRSAIPTSDENANQFPKGWQDLSRRRIDAENNLARNDVLNRSQGQPATGKLSDPPVATPMFDAPRAARLEDKLADLRKSVEAPKSEVDFGRNLIDVKELEASERWLKLQSSPSQMPATGEPPRIEVRLESEFERSKEKAAELPPAGDSGKKEILERKAGSNEPFPKADTLAIAITELDAFVTAPFGDVAGVPKPEPMPEGRPELYKDEVRFGIQDKNPVKPIEESKISGDANIRILNNSGTNVENFLGRKSVSPEAPPTGTEQYWSFQGQASSALARSGKEIYDPSLMAITGPQEPLKESKDLATGTIVGSRDELSLGEQAGRLDSSLLLSVTPQIVVQEEEEVKLGKAVRPSVELGFSPQDETKQELPELLKQKLAETSDYDEAIKQAQPVPYFRFISPSDQSGDLMGGLNQNVYRGNSTWFDNNFSSEGLRGEPGALSANRGAVQLGAIIRDQNGNDVLRESLAPSPELASKTRDYKLPDSRKGYIELKSINLEAPKPAPASLVEESAKDNAFSTFSLHVSDVSFKLAASALAQQQLPEASSIRVEEFVNAMDYRDPLPNNDQKVACAIEQSIHPALMQRNLLRISMRTAALGRSNNTPLRLTILLDNSGSMERADRRQAIQRAFQTLTQQLTEKDQITLISFANSPRLLADKMPGGQGEMLLQLVENMPSEGGTNIEAALRLAREKALEQKLDSAQNRIVLMTDGAVNLGDANPATLSKLVTELRDSGIAFDAAGICAQDLNDEVLEALTRQGDGRYYLLDTPQSIDAAFAAQIAGALRPTAQNVKVQVEFNPSRVGKYKLLGFEKHRLNQEDFRNDKVDAAELSAAEAGVAVYQIEPLQNGSGDIGSVSVRFRDVATGRMIERRWPIAYEDNPARIENASPTMKLAATASLLAVKLKSDPLAQNVDLAELSQWVAKLPEPFSSHHRTQQLQTMIEQLRQISK